MFELIYLDLFLEDQAIGVQSTFAVCSRGLPNKIKLKLMNKVHENTENKINRMKKRRIILKML